MEEEPVIVKETTWNNSYEESKALAEEAVSTWFTGLTGHLQQRDERAHAERAGVSHVRFGGLGRGEGRIRTHLVGREGGTRGGDPGHVGRQGMGRQALEDVSSANLRVLAPLAEGFGDEI